MKQVNIKGGKTIWINPDMICTVDYDKTDGSALLSMVSGEVIPTVEFAPELLLELDIINEEEAEILENHLLQDRVTGTKTGQK